jgi:hypothetical protein
MVEYAPRAVCAHQPRAVLAAFALLSNEDVGFSAVHCTLGPFFVVPARFKVIQNIKQTLVICTSSLLLNYDFYVVLGKCIGRDHQYYIIGVLVYDSYNCRIS